MEDYAIYYSPVICYKITRSENSYNLSVYIQGHQNSSDPTLCCTLEDFSDSEEHTRRFALSLAGSAALPIHIPELAEEFLSV